MTTPFTLLHDDWLQIAPLGDHPHQLGIQRIDAAAVAAMANRFNGFSARLGRLFSGVPLFEGHHDTDPEKYPNGKSFAWVMELQDRAADGLWGRVKWTPEGRALVTNGNYKFISPVWNAREIARQNGRPVFRPEDLLSLALTNLPNLPLSPLANSQTPMKKLTEILTLPESATADEICNATERLANSLSTLNSALSTLKGHLSLSADATAEQICEAVTRLNGQVSTLANESENLRTSTKSAVEKTSTLENQLSTLNSELRTAQSQFAAERSARVELIMANAIEKGRITLAQQDHWRAELAKDLTAAETALANEKTALNTTSATQNLGNAKAAYDTEATRRAALNDYITQQIANGATYDAAWAKAKLDRADIFANMRPK